jgi:diguanylate cyclase (GGDEF)-like protein/PAS domain S-box-containing protein
VGDTRDASEVAHELRVLLDAIPAPVFYKDAAGIYRGCNKAFEAYLGKSRDQIIGADVYGLSPKELADVYKAADDALFVSRATQIYEARVRYADGTYHDVMFHKATFDHPDGSLAGMIGTILDITTRKQAERALRESEERYRTVVSALGEGIVLIGRDRAVLTSNPAAESILRLDRERLHAGAPWPLVGDDGESIAIDEVVAATLAGRGDISGRVLALRHADGTRAWISLSTRAIGESGAERSAVVASFADVTERRMFLAQLEHQAFHDALTGLPNRKLFMQRLDHVLELARRRGERVAIAFIDLDGFKTVNDTLGHEAGDRLLTTLGRRLSDALRGSDIVARVGGDEFCAMLTGVADVGAARAIAQRMLDAIAPATDLVGAVITASIGLSVFPDDATEPAILLRHADAAMYRVKTAGKNAVGVFAT